MGLTYFQTYRSVAQWGGGGVSASDCGLAGEFFFRVSHSGAQNVLSVSWIFSEG